MTSIPQENIKSQNELIAALQKNGNVPIKKTDWEEFFKKSDANIQAKNTEEKKEKAINDKKEEDKCVQEKLAKIKFQKTDNGGVLNLDNCPCQIYGYDGFWSTSIYYFKDTKGNWYQNGKTFQSFDKGPFPSLKEAIRKTECHQ